MRRLAGEEVKDPPVEQSSRTDFKGTPRFRLVRCLAVGGMGAVYEAIDREHDRRVALKVVPSRMVDDLVRLKNEFRALQDLQHPNLVSLGELHEHQGYYFFTMDLIQGESFMEHVRPRDDEGDPRTTMRVRRVGGRVLRGRSLDEARLRSALAQLALGLTVLHASGRVHRDIKPSNILVTPQGRAVLLDLGLVTEYGPTKERSTQNIVGTATYMAPEQAGTNPVGPAADWYSVGVILYEALTGKPPITGEALDVLLTKQELDPPPPRELVPEVPEDLNALCVSLLQRDPATRADGAEVLRRLGVEAPSDRPEAVSAATHTRQATFVGREEELALLVEAFAEVRRGQVVAVILTGESGIGKTALARHFTSSIVSGGHHPVVLAGRCYEREGVPYRAIDGVIDRLSRYLTRLPDSEAAALLPRSVGLLADVFPVLRRVRSVAQAPRPPGTSPVEPQEQRTLLFGTLRELCARLTDRRPLVMFVDDLQWADADSLALISALLRPPDAPTMLFVATLRTDSDTATEPGARPTLPGDVRQLHLGRLPPHQARELAAHLLADTSAPIAPERVAQEAAGHPLYIHELVHHVAAQGAAPETDLRLESVLGARITALPREARRVLQLVAAAATPTTQELVARAAGQEGAAFDRSVALLRVASLVHTTGPRRSDMVQLYHDRVRDAVLPALAPEVRSALHAELAIALEASPEQNLEALAMQWRGAGDPERAAQYAARAAAEAEAGLAFDRAARLYRLALELHPPGAKAAQELLAKLGTALANAGRGPEAAGILLQAAGAAPPDVALDLRRRAAEQLLRSGHIEEGLQVTREILDAVGMKLPATTQQALVSLVLARASLRLRGLRFRERRASEIPARELTRIDICTAVGTALSSVDNVRGTYFNARALLLALRTGEPRRVALALCAEIAMSSFGGTRSERRTRRLLEVVGKLNERLDDPALDAWQNGTHGLASYYLGRFREGYEHLDHAERILRNEQAGMSWETATVQLFLLYSLFYLGRIGECSRRLPELINNASERGDLYSATNLSLGLLNAVWLVADDVERPRQIAREAAGRWTRSGFHVQHWFELVATSQLDLYAGSGDRPYRRLTERWPALEQSLILRLQLVRCEAWHLRARCALAAAATVPDPDRRDLLAVVETDARRILKERLPWATPLAKLNLAGAEVLRGNLGEAATHLGAAAAGFAAEDMALHAAVARYSLGQLKGGTEGASLVAGADSWLREQQIVSPARWVAMLVGAPLGA